MPECNTAPYKRLQCVLPCQCNYTANAPKQRTGLYSGFSCDCTHSATHDTRPTQADIIPLAPHWRAYTRPGALNLYTGYHCHAGTLHRPAQPPIIIRYIRGCRGAPFCGSIPDGAAYRRLCQRRRVNSYRVQIRWQVLRPAHLLRGQRLHLCRVSPAGSRCFPRPAAVGLAPVQRSGRAARNHWRLSPHLFSGCRPIANRGQQ